MEAECCNRTISITEPSIDFDNLNNLVNISSDVSEFSIDFDNLSNLLNSSSNANEEYYEASVVLNTLVIIMSTTSMLLSSFALKILAMCRKTPLQIRYLSMNVLMCLIIFETSMLLHTSALLLFGDTCLYIVIFNSRLFSSGVFVTTTWSSLCAVSVDRALALIMPFIHAKYATKTVLKIVIISLWVLNILVPTTTILSAIANVCGQETYISVCDVYAIVRPTRLGLSGLLMLYAILIIISCIKILHVAFKHKKKADKFTVNKTYLSDLVKSQKFSKSTRTVLLVILAFIVFESPIFFHLTVLEFVPHFQNHYWRRIFQPVDYLGHQMNIYASLYIYVWKFKECRMHFYFILSRLNRKYFESANALKMEVYDIVLKESASAN